MLRKVLKTREFAAGCTVARKYSILVRLTMYKYSLPFGFLYIYATGQGFFTSALQRAPPVGMWRLVRGLLRQLYSLCIVALYDV